MAVQYTINSNQNEYTIHNLNTTGVLYVTLYSQTLCGSDEWEIVSEEQPVPANGTIIISLPFQDGLYEFSLSDNMGDTETESIENFNHLFNTMIDDIQYVLCGCPCETCPDCNKKEKDYLSSILKLISYNILNDGFYNQYLLLTNSCVKCLVFDTNQCVLRTEIVVGNSDNTLLMKQLIAYYYLVYLYSDSVGKVLADIKKKYRYNEIIKCIKILGIDENCIKNEIIPA